MCTFMVALVEKFISESSLNYIGPSLITPEQESLDKSELPPFLQFSSVTQSCPTLYNPMNHSTPGLPVHHQLLEFTQSHVYRLSDAIQPSHPLSSPSPPAFNLSQHQGVFK